MLKLQKARFSTPPGPLSVRMANSDATATALLKHADFAADLIRFPDGGKVDGHTHAGDHLLFVVSGYGWVDYDGMPYPLSPGDCYLIPGEVCHGIRADSELTLIAVANQHVEAASPERLQLCECNP